MALVAAAACPTSAEMRPRATEVVVVKRAGVTAYEEVSEEFGERCRVRARVVTFGEDNQPAPPKEQLLQQAHLGRGTLVVTIGQEALDAVKGTDAHVIPTLAFHIPPGLPGPPAAPHPELVLRVLQTARRGVQTLAAVYGPRSESAIVEARDAAAKLGLQLVAARVDGGPAAVRALHQLVTRSRVQAIWLPGDTDVITPQVFQYALRLQLERGLPLVAATRQQVHSGALLAVDFAPRATGRAAAELANRLLEGRALATTPANDPEILGGARITVNAQAARRLGADSAALLRLGAKVE
jgi:hypothetical protein